jgi:hypothetical protein
VLRAHCAVSVSVTVLALQTPLPQLEVVTVRVLVPDVAQALA